MFMSIFMTNQGTQKFRHLQLYTAFHILKYFIIFPTVLSLFYIMVDLLSQNTRGSFEDTKNTVLGEYFPLTFIKFIFVELLLNVHCCFSQFSAQNGILILHFLFIQFHFIYMLFFTIQQQFMDLTVMLLKSGNGIWELVFHLLHATVHMIQNPKYFTQYAVQLSLKMGRVFANTFSTVFDGKYFMSSMRIVLKNTIRTQSLSISLTIQSRSVFMNQTFLGQIVGIHLLNYFDRLFNFFSVFLFETLNMLDI